LECLPVAETAAQLAISADACKQRLHRGRDTLRERLERRGVRLASLALLLGLVEELCRSSQAWAAELPVETRSVLTKAALTQASGLGAAHASAPSTQRAAAAAALALTFENTLAGASAEPGLKPERNPHMIKIAMTCVVASFLLVAGLLLMSSRSKDPSALNKVERNDDSSPQTPAPAKEVKPAQALIATAATDSLPLVHAWQPPRFFDGELFPLAVASRSTHAAVMILERVGDECCAFLLESTDGGQSWQRGETLHKFPLNRSDNANFEGSTCGSLAYSEDGALVATLKTYLDKYARWIVLPRNKSAGEEVFHESDTFFPRVIRVPGGTWTFGIHTANRTSSRGPWTVRAAYGAGLAVPTEVEAVSGYGGEFGPSAWALDAQTAGVVVLDGLTAAFSSALRPEAPAKSARATLSLKHFLTCDGGKTWQSTNIPFEFDDGSERVPSVAVPYGLSRQGNRLGLLLHRVEGHEGQQWHLLISENLGKDWEPAKKAARLDAGHGVGTSGLHLMGGYAVHCFTQYKYPDRSFHDPFDCMNVEYNRADLFFTQDNGGLWFNPHIFDRMGTGVMTSVIGGDERSCHVVFRKTLGKRVGSFSELTEQGIAQKPQKVEKTAEKHCLIIRSWAGGEWEADAQKPSWFKEERLPEPTKEEF